MTRRLRLGMVGGGEGAFIGAVHRMAARLDDRYEFVAGALSSDPGRATASAASLGLASDRSYSDYLVMAQREAERDDGIDVVAIVTPNHLHHDAALAFLSAGIHVICDKPLGVTVAEGEQIAEAVASGDAAFVMTYGFTGYPMVRHARQLVAEGALGEIRNVEVEYPQDWLASQETVGPAAVESIWRLDPARGGEGGCVGDIGTHAFHMAEFVIGRRVTSLSGRVATFVTGRAVPDDAHIAVRWDDGAQGAIWLSQVAIGNENALRLRVFGDRAGLSWEQERPDRLELTELGEATRLITRGGPSAGSAAAHATRVPSGHPEGYIEAFAQIYRDAADLLVAWPDSPIPDGLPGIAEGLRGMDFIAAVLASSRADSAWIPLPERG